MSKISWGNPWASTRAKLYDLHGCSAAPMSGEDAQLSSASPPPPPCPPASHRAVSLHLTMQTTLEKKPAWASSLPVSFLPFDVDDDLDIAVRPSLHKKRKVQLNIRTHYGERESRCCWFKNKVLTKIEEKNAH